LRPNCIDIRERISTAALIHSSVPIKFGSKPLREFGSVVPASVFRPARQFLIENDFHFQFIENRFDCQPPETIIFGALFIAAGHLYERFLSVMLYLRCYINTKSKRQKGPNQYRPRDVSCLESYGTIPALP
jgi:hypothetical protein